MSDDELRVMAEKVKATYLSDSPAWIVADAYLADLDAKQKREESVSGDELKAAAELYKKYQAGTGIDSKAEYERFADARERLTQWAVDNLDAKRQREAEDATLRDAVKLLLRSVVSEDAGNLEEPFMYVWANDWKKIKRRLLEAIGVEVKR